MFVSNHLHFGMCVLNGCIYELLTLVKPEATVCIYVSDVSCKPRLGLHGTTLLLAQGIEALGIAAPYHWLILWAVHICERPS